MKTLKAKDGYKYFDGEHVLTIINMPDGADPSIWKEITEDEAIRILEKQELEYYREQEKLRNGR